MRLLLRVARVALCATVAAAATSACYSSGDGTSPPTASFYFPVGLAVSPGGRVLYAVNSDFDLQYNGGTLQSYDLQQMRHDAAALVAYNVPPGADKSTIEQIPFVSGIPAPCLAEMYVLAPGAALDEGCAPPVDGSAPIYFKDSVTVGAFATDLQLQVPPRRRPFRSRPRTAFTFRFAERPRSRMPTSRTTTRASPPTSSSSSGRPTRSAPTRTSSGIRAWSRCPASPSAWR